MDMVLLGARLLLALVFGVAGLAKAADTAGFRRTLVAFGVPDGLAAPLGRILPFVEVLAALALLPLASAWWGAVLALLLLSTFSAAIAMNLARGQTPECNCFGQLHSAPLSWSVFARNVALAGVAAFIAARGRDDPGASAFNWLTTLTAGETAGLIFNSLAVGLLITGVVYVRRLVVQQTAIVEKIEAMKKVVDEDYFEPPPVERGDAASPADGLPVGAPAPHFALVTLAGAQATLSDLLALGNPLLLLFVSPTCSPCKTLLPTVRVWERDYGNRLTVALLSKGTPDENVKRVAKYGATRLLLQGESSVAADYQASWTPAAVVVSAEGKIASRMTYGNDAIHALISHAITTGVGRTAGEGAGEFIPQITVGKSLFKIGEPAPRFSLRDLRSREIHVQELLGRDTLLLFWDPACHFCQAMSQDLQRWEERPASTPRLAIIASGDMEGIRALDKEFTSLILVDSGFDVAPLFGATSTPSAVLIDGAGRIASSLAVGSRNVLALAGFL